MSKESEIRKKLAEARRNGDFIQIGYLEAQLRDIAHNEPYSEDLRESLKNSPLGDVFGAFNERK